MDWLRIAPKTKDDLACPHGVQFYDVVGGGAVSRRAAWSYEAPRPANTLSRHRRGGGGDDVFDAWQEEHVAVRALLLEWAHPGDRSQGSWKCHPTVSKRWLGISTFEPESGVI